jgi:hypothetical protein
MGELMASVIPAFATALQDHALRGNPKDVYVWCHEHLDTVDFRAVKVIEVEQDLQMNRVTVTRALDRLVEYGYLKRGPRDGRIWTYRLVYSRPRLPEPPWRTPRRPV